MAARYGFNSVTLSVPAGTNRVQALNGNASRVSLIVSCANSNSIRVSSLGGSSADGVWVIVIGRDAIVFKFADVGPVMQQPVYVSHFNSVAVEIVVTEVYKLPGCK